MFGIPRDPPLHQMSEEVLVKIGPQLKSSTGGLLLTLDASISQTHTRSASVTDHPVESGADVSDHIRVDPIRVTVNGIVTATRLGQQGDTTKEIEAWATLEGLLEAKTPITLVTSLRTYDSMVLVSCSTSREKSLAHAIAPQLEFRQVRIVKSQTVTLPPEQIRKPLPKSSAPPPKDVGKQPTDVPTADQRSSLMYKIGQAAVP